MKGYYLLPENAARGTCRSCGKEIAWVSSGRGASVPVDPSETQDGFDGTYALTHFANCPQGRAWSEKGKAKR